MRQRGFSMLEVLVSMLIICLGVLGMVALQTRSLALSQDSIQRTNAMILASDLIELMRSNPQVTLDDGKFKVDGRYAKQIGNAFRPVALDAGEDCLSRNRALGGDTVAGKDLSCWLIQVKALLPVTDQLINDAFAVCPAAKSPITRTEAALAATAPSTVCEAIPRAAVMVVLAWQSPGADSLNCPQGLCYYALRSEL